MKNIFKSAVLIFMIFSAPLFLGCSSDKMPEATKKTFDRFIGYWNSGQFDGIEEVLTQDFEMIESPEFEPRKGIDYFKKLVSNTRTTFPDFRIVVNEIIYSRDRAAFIWTVTGTQTGPGEISPTGRTINGKGISVLHFSNGKVKDEWLANNNLQWFMQLGYTIVPPEVK